MKAAIAIDAWKGPIFQRHLKQAGIAFEFAGDLNFGTAILTVVTDDAVGLTRVVKAAQDECHRVGEPNQ